MNIALYIGGITNSKRIRNAQYSESTVIRKSKTKKNAVLLV